MTALSLDARLATVNAMLRDCEAFLQDLRNEPRQPAGTYVIGWENGLYVRVATGGPVGRRAVSATNVLAASLWSETRPAPRNVFNGSNEGAERIEFERAIAREITRQEDLHTWMCGQYRDLLQEQVDASIWVQPEGSLADA